MSTNNKLIWFLATLIISNSCLAQVTGINQNIKTEMLRKGTYNVSCPVPPERLSLVTFNYINFNGVEHNDGKIVVMDAVAKNVENIFKELFKIKFPIAQSKRIEYYNGSDELSLAANNTSAYNCRQSTEVGSSLPSLHSYGLAIDINPTQNPFVGLENSQQVRIKVEPIEGKNYLNRTNLRPGMAETVVEIFKKHGFTVWGGKWNTPIDWQHFQTPRSVSQILAAMNTNDARTFFNLYTKKTTLFDKFHYKDKRIVDLYESSPQKFMQIINKNFAKLNALEPDGAINFIRTEISRKS